MGTRDHNRNTHRFKMTIGRKKNTKRFSLEFLTFCKTIGTILKKPWVDYASSEDRWDGLNSPMPSLHMLYK